MRLNYLLKKIDSFLHIRVITYCPYKPKEQIILYEGIAIAVPDKLKKGKIYKWNFKYDLSEMYLEIYLKFRGCKKCYE